MIYSNEILNFKWVKLSTNHSFTKQILIKLCWFQEASCILQDIMLSLSSLDPHLFFWIIYSTWSSYILMTSQQHRKKQESRLFCYLFCFLRTGNLWGQHVFPNKLERIVETASNEVCIRIFGIFNPIPDLY